MNRKQLESGQGTLEYALMISLVGIVALITITILANPQDFREGILYQGIYRPVQCAVQGISRDNCEDAALFASIRYPSVQDGDSRKLCSNGTYVTADEAEVADPDDPWALCSSGGGGIAAPEEMLIGDITWQEVGGDSRLGFLTDGAELPTEGLFDFGATNNSGPIESVNFIVRRTDPTTATIITNTDNEADYMANDFAGVNLTEGTYEITVTPYSGDGPSGDMGASVTITFTVKPAPVVPPTIAGFSLVDSTTSTVLFAIQDTRIYEQQEYAVIVDTTGDAERVEFTLNGPGGFQETGSIEDPFSLFGVVDNNPVGRTPPAGDYTLSASVFDPTDTEQDTRTVRFTIEAPQTDFEVAELRLVDASVDQERDPNFNEDPASAVIVDGMTMVLDPNEDFVSFIALVPDGAEENIVQSVVMELTGPTSHTQTESQPPYALFGDSNGDYDGSYLQPGSYTLTATPYDQNSGNGEEGRALTVSFTVEEPPEVAGPQITDVWLYNINTNQRVRRLSNNDTINLGVVDYNWRIQNDTSPMPVSSVDYTLSGDRSLTSTERRVAYDFPNSSDSLNLSAGSYTLEIAATADGVTGPTRTINLDVVEAFTCTDTRVELADFSCDAYEIRATIRTYCGEGTRMAFTNPISASPTSETSAGTAYEHQFIWSGSYDPVLDDGSLARVCDSGEWDPATLRVNFGSGALIEQYDMNFTGGGSLTKR